MKSIKTLIGTVIVLALVSGTAAFAASPESVGAAVSSCCQFLAACCHAGMDCCA